MKRIKRRCKSKSIILLITSFVLTVLLFPWSAFAMRFELGSDVLLDVDLTFSYGVAMRVTDPDKDLLENPNTDDGNHNYERYDLVNNKLSLIADIELNFGDFGLFTRGKAFYDNVYMMKNANKSPDSNNALQGGLIDKTNEWTDEVKNKHGQNAEILDLFAYTSFRLAGVPMDFRVGKQVISWGESQLIPNVSGAQSPLDYSAAVSAGTEVREIMLPTGAAYLQVGLTGDLGLNLYYQWQWEKNRVPESGTFLSNKDMIGEAKLPTIPAPGATIPRVKEKDARDDGQWGVALTYLTPWLNSMQVGIYHINYHDKNPTLEYDYSDIRNITYSITYTEDIKLTGLSFSTTILAASVWFEISQRNDIRFQHPETGEVEMGDYQQANLGFLYSGNPGFLADNLALFVEASAAQMVGFDVLENEYAWQNSSKIILDWFQVLPLFDLNLILGLSETPVGWIESMLFREGYSTFSTAVGFAYDKVFKGALAFDDRFIDNDTRDRDSVSLSLSYSF